MDTADFPEDVDWLKPATDDLKAFYIESMTAKPGRYDETEVSDQFWQHTELGAALILIYEHFLESEVAHQRIFARMLAPREAVSRASRISGCDRARSESSESWLCGTNQQRRCGKFIGRQV